MAFAESLSPKVAIFVLRGGRKLLCHAVRAGGKRYICIVIIEKLTGR